MGCLFHIHVLLNTAKSLALYFCCILGFVVPPLKCTSALGMQSKSIPDSKITASSEYNADYDATRSRLNTARQGRKGGSWIAKYNNVGQWVEVEFDVGVKFTGIATQGRPDANQWVTSYRIEYSLDGHFVKYNGGKVFGGNKDRNGIVGHYLDPAIHAKAIRIVPVTWYGHITMRFELYGCKQGIHY